MWVIFSFLTQTDSSKVQSGWGLGRLSDNSGKRLAWMLDVVLEHHLPETILTVL